MKRIILIAFLLIPFFAFSQTTKPIDGVLGIKFGAAKLSVVAAIKAKGGNLDVAHSNANVKMFMNVKFGSYTPLVLIVKFLDDKFYVATFLFKSADDSNTIANYNDLVSSINKTYGAGSPTKTFSASFVDGDGKELEAIQGGNADYHTFWSSGKNSVMIAINSKLYIGLTCQVTKLNIQAQANQN